MTRDEHDLGSVVRQQHGMASLDQVLAAGITRDELRAHLGGQRWARIHRATYATFSGPLTRQAQLWAALLACGPGSVLSHESAAECDGLVEPTSGTIHVTVPVQRRVVAPAGVRVHYLTRLPAALHPSRTPPRLRIEETVLGLTDAAPTSAAAVAWVFSACQRRLTTPDRLTEAMGERKKMRWRAVLEDSLTETREGAHSPLEHRFAHRVERAHGLPRGVRQHPGELDHRRVWRDVAYRRYATLVELDGRLGHDGDGRWRDMHRDNAATVHGYQTLRFGWLDVVAGGCKAAGQLATVLRANGWTGTPCACGPACSLDWPPVRDHVGTAVL